MNKIMVIINPTSGGEKALDYKEKLEIRLKITLSKSIPELHKKLKTQPTSPQKLLKSIMMLFLYSVEMGQSMK